MKLKMYYADGGRHPVLGQVFHQCQEVSDGKEKERYQRYLANILSGIAPTPEDCDRILNLVEGIKSGRALEAEVEGNDVEVTISKSGVQVDITVNDDWMGQLEGRFLFREFETAIDAWKEFLKMPESFESEVIVEL